MESLLAHILDAASRAPSAHNTQPWVIRWCGDAIEIRVNRKRCLPAADPSHIDTLHSLGAMLENVTLTLAQLGFTSAHEVAERLDLDAPVVVVRWHKSEQVPPDAALYRMIPIRHTSRLPYLLEPVEPAVLDALRATVAPRCVLHFVTNTKAITEARSLAAEATAELLTERTTTMELREWIRFSQQDHRWYRDGLTAACLGWKPWEAAVAKLMLSPAMLRFLTRWGLHRTLCANLDQQAPPAPILCLLTVVTENCAARIEAGRCLQRLWLTAAWFGLTTHPLNAALDVSRTRVRIRELFHALPSHHLVNFFRLGRSADPARSPRLPADEILYNPVEAERLSGISPTPPPGSVELSP